MYTRCKIGSCLKYLTYIMTTLSSMTLHIIDKSRYGAGYVLEKKNTKYFPSCVHVFVCVHMHTFVYVCLYASQHMFAYMWYQRPIAGCSFPLLSTCFCYYFCLLACFWGRASHFCLELNDLSSLPVQWVPGIHLFLLLQGHNYELCYHIHLLLFGLLGSSSGLHAWTESTFYPLSYLPSPHGRGLSRLILGKKKILLGKKRSLWIKCHPMDSQQIHLSWQAVRKK